MEQVFRSVLEALDRVVDAVGGWIRGGADAIDPLQPGTWSAGFWALVGALAVLLVLALLRRRSRRPAGARVPELLVTRGEVVPDPGVRRGGAGTLKATVSNMSRFPVQILEVAVRTGGGRRFGVAEVGALVPAMGDVEVEARLPVGRLEDGVLDVYAYAAATRVKTYRHRAELIWEPWAKRFKVAPLEQRIVATRTLASARADVVRLQDDEEDARTWATAPVAASTVPEIPAPRPATPPIEVPALPLPSAAPHDEAPEPGAADLFAMLDERPPLARRATPAQVLALNEVLVPADDPEDEEATPRRGRVESVAPERPAGRPAERPAGRVPSAHRERPVAAAPGRAAEAGPQPHRLQPERQDTRSARPPAGQDEAAGPTVRAVPPPPPRTGAEARATRTNWGRLREEREPPAAADESTGPTAVEQPAAEQPAVLPRGDRVAEARARLLERRRRRAEEAAADGGGDDDGRPRRRPDDGRLDFPDEF